jgi:hypothetical protein
MRSIEQLEVERSYLLSRLYYEDRKATSLLKSLKNLEDTVQQGLESRRDRGARKKLGYLRYRICECTEQEKAILARLDHIAAELQLRKFVPMVESPLGCYFTYHTVNLHGCPETSSYGFPAPHSAP